MIMRDILLYLSKQKWLQNFIVNFKITKKMARRFVAGEKLEDDINAIKELNAKGMLATVDHLGENITTKEQAILAAQEYLLVLDKIASFGVNSNASVKLTQMGLDIDYKLCSDNIEKIISKARELKNFVRIDMEGSEHTQRTLNIFKEMRRNFSNVGIVVQSYLYRTEKDVEEILSMKAGVRLCKGAYKEPKEIAYPKMRDVDANFIRLMKMLLKSGIYHGIATHDKKIIEETKRFAKEEKIEKKSFEFQMLYGIRRDLQEQLVAEGYNMRIYMPYGDQWYPYFMRRLAERPANLFFFIKNFLKG
jgi:proline dehydrogenase